MRSARRRIGEATLAASVACLVALGATATPADATDLEAVRERAQALGDEVSQLEAGLAKLTRRKSTLADDIVAASAELGVLETQVHDAQRAHDAAMDEYVSRAIEAYKDGPGSDIAMLLSATTLDQLYAAAELSGYSARRDARALEELVAAKDEAQRAQERIDQRKQRLLAKHAEVDEVTTEIEVNIAARSRALDELTAEIRALERQAAAAAAAAARPDEALLDLLQPSGPAPGIPDGFAGTGVTFEGIASWYGPGFEGNPTANGDIFDPDLFTAASKELPLGTWLYVTHGGRGVVVLVNDRGPYVDGRILDLSQAAAESLGIGGLGWIRAEILIKA